MYRSEMEFSFISLFYNLQPAFSLSSFTLALLTHLAFRAFSLCDCVFEPEESELSQACAPVLLLKPLPNPGGLLEYSGLSTRSHEEISTTRTCRR
jgi:hypothetical protein